MKGGFNLSRWALKHIPLTRFLMVVLLIGGVAQLLPAWARTKTRRSPSGRWWCRPYWPGATAQQMADQVTDKLEKKLQETP